MSNYPDYILTDNKLDNKILSLLKKNKNKIIKGIIKELKNDGLIEVNLDHASQLIWEQDSGCNILFELGILKENSEWLCTIGNFDRSNNEYNSYFVQALLNIGFSIKEALYLLDFYDPNKHPDYVLPVVKLAHHWKVKYWCALPYQGHKIGCPNYGKKDKCPPNSPCIENLMQIDKEMFLVYSEFDLQAHIDKMKAKHPNWTDRQLRNVLYWQSRSKKQMAFRSIKFAKENGFDMVIFMGESVGINLYKTCRLSGLKLEPIKDLKICRHVAVVGYSKKGVFNDPKYKGMFLRL